MSDPVQKEELNESVFEQIGQQFVRSGAYSQQAPDRIGELFHRAHEVANELRFAKLANVEEPETGVTGLVKVMPDGRVEALGEHVFDAFRPRPKHKTGTAHLKRVESFVDLVNYQKTDTSALFANDETERPAITCVFDYNDVDLPNFGQHRATFAFPLSKEWKAWTGANGKQFTIADFGRFLEDHFVDVQTLDGTEALSANLNAIIAKDGASKVAGAMRLLELGRGLTIHEKSVISESRNLATGEGELIFQTENVGANGEKLNVPSLFVIAIPVFQRGDAFRIAVRLRHRVNKESGAKFWFELWRHDEVFDIAYAEACEAARDGTGLPLYFGAPE
jgi:uncharacterized protein YfdQ (DUF2303 family)